MIACMIEGNEVIDLVLGFDMMTMQSKLDN